jgi:hypothetical protein
LKFPPEHCKNSTFVPQYPISLTLVDANQWLAGMIFAIYFQRTSSRIDISLTEWLAAVNHVEGVRQASDCTADPNDWVGYWVNPRGGPTGQFHHRPDRAFDAEVFFPDDARWRRALYWHAIRDTDRGVITFEAGTRDAEKATYPVRIAAAALARLLDAELVDQDETFYE